MLGALGWVGRGVWLWWARWAGFGADLAVLGRAAGHVSSCLHDCLCSCVSKMCILGLEQNMDRPSQKEPKARLL